MKSFKSYLREAAGPRETIDLGKSPKVKAFVKKAFPDYRKRKVTFRVTDSVTLSGGYWSGGSRTEWFGVQPNGARFPLTYPTNPPQFAGGGKPPVFKITDIKWVAEGGSFGGKPSSLTFYVSSGWRGALEK